LVKGSKEKGVKQMGVKQGVVV